MHCTHNFGGARLLFCLLSFAVLFSCEDEPAPLEPIPVLTKIQMDSQGRFVDRSGKNFFPWGLNYTNAEGVELIEDNWENAETWELIEEDFADMRQLSANIVRIHLQYHKFMLGPTTPDDDALNRLADLVSLAEQSGLYLDITGLASYRKSDVPAFYNDMSDEARWETQKIFWQNIAERVGSSPAVFAYNLMNEPVVSVSCDVKDNCEWTPGEGFGGFHFIQNISRDPKRMVLQTMKEWIAELTGAIRSKDDETMITVGFLGLGPLDRFADDLDYVSVHIYPESGKLDEAADYILSKDPAITLVLEETSNLRCTAKELATFLDMIEGQYHGLMGHYHGTSLNDINALSIKGALQRQFLNFFKDNKPD